MAPAVRGSVQFARFDEEGAKNDKKGAASPRGPAALGKWKVASSKGLLADKVAEGTKLHFSDLVSRNTTRSLKKRKLPSFKRTATVSKALAETSRSESTLIGLLWPAEEDDALNPAQVVQMFWSLLFLELVRSPELTALILLQQSDGTHCTQHAYRAHRMRFPSQPHYVMSSARRSCLASTTRSRPSAP